MRGLSRRRRQTEQTASQGGKEPELRMDEDPCGCKTGHGQLESREAGAPWPREVCATGRECWALPLERRKWSQEESVDCAVVLTEREAGHQASPCPSWTASGKRG